MHEICPSIFAALAPCAHCEAVRGGGREDGGDVSDVVGCLLESTKIFYKRPGVEKGLAPGGFEEKDEEHEEEEEEAK